MSEPTLRRVLGKWDLTAIGVNQVLGGAVFLMPAVVAAQLGAWSWMAVGMAGLLAMLIALNFAEAGSRFQGTGGPYLYTRQAFGRFVSFEVGWMMWATRVTSWASIVNGLADALGFYWPLVRVGAARATLITGVMLIVTGITLRGIRQSAIAVNVLTIGKLVPLVLFILLGLPRISIAALHPEVALTWTQVSTAALYLIFLYGGYEVISVPAGEAKNPQRTVPFAMVATICIVAVVLTLVQVVTLGTLPDLASSRTTTPLADASMLFLGGWGALLLTVGTMVSITGTNVGGALSGSRTLYALAEQGDLPRTFSRVHARFRTPAFAIAFTSLVTWVLALFASFATLAQASSVARLLVYAGTCASVIALRRLGRAPFTIPGGVAVPALAFMISVAILYGVSPRQIAVGLAFMAAGAVLFFVARKGPL
jgi:amino acid transporter